MPNKELLLRTLEHIKANPKEWSQRYWHSCFAGWTIRLNDPAVTLQREADGCDGLCCAHLERDGQELSLHRVPVGAEEILDLDPTQADHLFADWNTLEDLERVVGELTAEPAGEEVPA